MSRRYGSSSSRFRGFAGIETSRPSRTNARITFSCSVSRRQLVGHRRTVARPGRRSGRSRVGYDGADAPRRPPTRRPPAARHRNGPRGRPRQGDRRHRAPDLRRQPDGLATPGRAAPTSRRPSGSGSREHDIGPVAIHAAYLVNLAGPDDGLLRALGRGPDHDLRGAPGLRGELRQRPHRVAPRRGRRGGDRSGSPTASPRVSPRRTADPDGAVLVLENSAGGGFGIGTTVEELADIAEAIAARGVADDRVGFCLDTAHAWGAGYRLSDPDATDDAPRRRSMPGSGSAGCAMVHLNDSKSELGSHIDRHEHVGAGQIGEAGMAHLLRHPLLATPPTTSRRPAWTRATTRSTSPVRVALAAGRPLEPLPPGAMTLRGSRARSAARAGARARAGPSATPL